MTSERTGTPPAGTSAAAGRPLLRPFGRGRAVSLFTLGTMRAIESAAQMAAVLDAAVACGIHHLETAPAYGPAETFLAAALASLEQRDPAARRGLVLTSKLLPGLSLAQGQLQLRALLARLQIAQLDNLAVHGLNTAEHLHWALRGDGRELLSWAMAEGLVGQVGFSSHGSSALIEAALASERFSFCSLHLHLFDRERLPLARQALAAGLGVMAISPADKGGRLYDPPPELQADCAPFHPLELAYRFLLDQGISTLTLGAAQPGDLAWAEVLAQGPGGAGGCSRLSPEGGRPGEPVGQPGAGFRLAGAAPAPPAAATAATSVHPAAEPAQEPAKSATVAADVSTRSEPPGAWLQPEHHAALERLAAAGASRLGSSRCGQCRACLPCPNQVPIPALLRLRNLAIGHGMVPFASERYSLIGRAAHWWEQRDASACERCGDCLPRCPLQLPIPDLLADTHRRLAAPPRRRLWG